MKSIVIVSLTLCNLQMMFKHLKTILDDALRVWPTAPVKLLYMEKLIVPKMQQNPDSPPPSVTVALEVSADFP